MSPAAPTALVTGASAGLGREFARQLALRGHDLVLVARRRDRLDDLAEELRQATGSEVTVIVQDLAEPAAAATLHSTVTELGIRIDLLINNAGIGTTGDLLETDPDRLDQLVSLNITTLTGLSRRFGADMVTVGRGTILNIASLAAVMPTPHMAVYGASKAYVLNVTLALEAELWGSGVRAIPVLPSATRTEFAASGGKVPGPEQLHADPTVVVGQILAALDRKKPPLMIVPGRGNALMAPILARLPRRLGLTLLKRVMRF